MFLCFQTDDELYNACRFIPMFSSIAHKIVPRSYFVRMLDYAQILGVRALNCARFFSRSRSKLSCRLCTKLCPNFGRSRARLCPISVAPNTVCQRSVDHRRLSVRPFERTLTLQKDSAGFVGFVFKENQIVSIVKDSSAARNGLLIEHHLVEVDGQNVVGLKVSGRPY